MYLKYTIQIYYTLFILYIHTQLDAAFAKRPLKILVMANNERKRHVRFKGFIISNFHFVFAAFSRSNKVFVFYVFTSCNGAGHKRPAVFATPFSSHTRNTRSKNPRRRRIMCERRFERLNGQCIRRNPNETSRYAPEQVSCSRRILRFHYSPRDLCLVAVTAIPRRACTGIAYSPRRVNPRLTMAHRCGQ